MNLLPPDWDEDDFSRQLTTVVGWREYVASTELELPTPLTLEEYEALSEEDRLLNDEDRLDQLARLQVVHTSTVRRMVTCGRRLTIMNGGVRRDQSKKGIGALSARRGLMATGPANTGKTIALVQLGRWYELRDRLRHPGQSGRIPVIYITVPPSATARMIAAELARFLGLPVTSRANLTDITEAVVGVCTKAGTGLILVDEIHNIALDTKNGAEASDSLKYFSERLPVTFAYAGINLERILTGTRGEQIAARFTPVETASFPYNAEWRAVVGEMEKTLLLYRHKPESLLRMSRFLHTLTDGMIGTLSHLIRGAAIDAILSGEEAITKKGLLAVELDLAAKRKRRGKPPEPEGDE